MTISWFGQSCFRIESKDTRILFDPFSKEIGLKPPRLNDNIVLCSHDHYDHNNLESASPETFVINTPGEFEKNGVQIVGVLSEHDNDGGKERGFSTIYVVKVEDVTLCHLGDLGQLTLRDEQIENIGDVDVLFIPVGGVYTINGAQAAAVVKQIEPKIVIPMHYKIPGLIFNIEGPEKFIKELGLKAQEVDSLKISQKNLPVEETQVYIFKI